MSTNGVGLNDIADRLTSAMKARSSAQALVNGQTPLKQRSYSPRKRHHTAAAKVEANGEPPLASSIELQATIDSQQIDIESL